jgi:hypothetical protein
MSTPYVNFTGINECHRMNDKFMGAVHEYLKKPLVELDVPEHKMARLMVSYRLKIMLNNHHTGVLSPQIL